LPESLKLMPLHTVGLLKSIGLRENPKLATSPRHQQQTPDPRADERAAFLNLLEFGSPLVVHRLCHPRLFDVQCFDPTNLAHASGTASPQAPKPGQTLTAPSSSSSSSHASNSFVAPSSSSTPTAAAPKFVGWGSTAAPPASAVPAVPAAAAAATEPAPEKASKECGSSSGSSSRVCLPAPLPCSAASLGANKILLLDAGTEMFLWVGTSVESHTLQQVRPCHCLSVNVLMFALCHRSFHLFNWYDPICWPFCKYSHLFFSSVFFMSLQLFGVSELSPASPPSSLLPNSANKDETNLFLAHLKAALSELRRDMPCFAPLKVVVATQHGMRGDRSEEEERFLSLLVEDKTRHEQSYVDFLCSVHRKVQVKMAK
jgi:hypothetical protein